MSGKILFVYSAHRWVDETEAKNNAEIVARWYTKISEKNNSVSNVSVMSINEWNDKKTGLISCTLNAVVFCSERFIEEAETLKHERPDICVIILTGLLPNNKVFYVPKGGKNTGETLYDLIRE